MQHPRKELAQELLKADEDEREQLKKMGEHFAKSFRGIVGLGRAAGMPQAHAIR